MAAGSYGFGISICLRDLTMSLTRYGMLWRTPLPALQATFPHKGGRKARAAIFPRRERMGSAATFRPRKEG
jgi:hypothetical protein